MKVTFYTILPFAATILAFADPKGHEYRASGPFDSEPVRADKPCSGELTVNSQVDRLVQDSTL